MSETFLVMRVRDARQGRDIVGAAFPTGPPETDGVVGVLVTARPRFGSLAWLRILRAVRAQQGTVS